MSKNEFTVLQTQDRSKRHDHKADSRSVWPGNMYHAYSPPILDVGAEAAFAEMAFDHERFSARYIPIKAEVSA